MIRSDREASMSAAMLPSQANVAGNVHGGEIMHMMDTTAWLAAIKYAHSQAVTARVDELQFLRPIYVGNLVTCMASIAYVGNSTMEVKVTTMVEDCLGEDNEPKIALTGFFTMVAMDENGKPRKVEPLVPETEEEIRLYREAEARRAYYRKRLVRE